MRATVFFYCLLAITVFTRCTSGKKLQKLKVTSTIGSLKFLDEYDLPHGLQFMNTTVGGLSGIDYDKSKNIYYLISDDPGAYGSSRFYTAKIFLSHSKIDSLAFINMTPLLNPQGKIYSDIREDRLHSLDGEALRYNEAADEMVYSSEGQRFETKEKQVLVQNPTIYTAHPDGSFKDSFAIPLNMYIRNTENGPRHNGVFEGIAFTHNPRYLFVSLEEPIYEDGPRAATGDTTGWTRFLKFDFSTKKEVAQYAYKLTPVPYMPDPPGAFKINGVSDIMALDENTFIVIERAYMTGRIPSYIQIFLADISGATDIAGVQSIPGHPGVIPITKTLLFNMESLHRHIDNIEGVTYGPLLANGHQSMLFIVDDNFSALEKEQLFLFEVIP